MKSNIFFLIFLLLMLGACNRDSEDSVIKTDQVLNIYMGNVSGTDLLNTDNEKAYASIKLLDIGGENASQSFSGYSLKMDTDSTYYYYYTAGATRNLVSTAGDTKIYRSDITFNLYKESGDATASDIDTMTVLYRWTPGMFQVSSVVYDRDTLSIERHTDEDGLPYNVVKIVK